MTDLPQQSAPVCTHTTGQLYLQSPHLHGHNSHNMIPTYLTYEWFVSQEIPLYHFFLLVMGFLSFGYQLLIWGF